MGTKQALDDGKLDIAGPIAGGRISDTPGDFGSATERIILDEFAPPYAVVDTSGRVVHLSTRIDRFLLVPERGLGEDVTRMARPGLGPGLRAAFARAKRSLRPETCLGAVIEHEHEHRHIRITVRPVSQPRQAGSLYLIVFADLGQVTEAVGQGDRLDDIDPVGPDLEAANADLENVLRSTQIATIFLDDDGSVRRFTPAAAAIYDLTPSDIGRPLEVLTHRLSEMPPIAAPTASADPIENEVSDQDGRWYLRRILPYRNVDGITRGRVVTFVEITAQKRIQQRLRAAEAELAARLAELDTIYRTAPAGLALFDREFRYQRVNDALAETNGLPVEAHIGRRMADILPGIADGAERALRRVFETGEAYGPFELEGETPKAPGRRRVWLDTFTPVRGEHGQIIGVSASALEITELRAALEALAASEARYRQLADAMPQLVWTANSDAVVDYYNNRLGEYAAEARRPDGSFDWTTLVHPDDLADTLGAWRSANAAGEVFSIPHRLRMADGSYRWHVSRGVPKLDEALGTRRWFGSATDVDELRSASERLGKRESLYRVALEAGELGVWDFDPVTRDIDLDDRARRLLGVAETGPVRYADVLGAVHQDDRAALEMAVAEAVDPLGDEPFDLAYRIVHRGGSVCWVSVHGRAMFAEGAAGRRVLRFSGTVRDVTERVSSEYRLAASEQRLRLALQAGQFGAWEWNILENRLAWTDQYFRLLGYEPGSVVPSKELWLERLHEADRGRVEAAVARARDGGEIYEVEYRIVTPVGQERHLSARGRFLYENGEAVVMYGVLGDRTAKHRSERALAEREEQYRLALESAQLGSWMWEPESDAMVLSARAAEIFDWPDLHVTRDNLRRRLHPDDLEPSERAIVAALEAVRDYCSEYRIVRRDGRVSWVQSRGRAFYDAHNNPIRVFGIIQDITEQKHAQEHTSLIIQEMNHRVKNSLAMLQSIATQSARNTPSKETFVESLLQRIRAMSQAHDLLTRSEWRGARLRDVLVEQLRSFGGLYGSRFIAHGPPIHLGPRTALSLGLVIHELATNAVKHGALSAPHGVAEISWAMHEDPAGGAFELHWIERDGPPVATPQRKGFGSTMIERTLSHSLGARVTVDYAPGGIRVSLYVPIEPVPTRGD